MLRISEDGVSESDLYRKRVKESHSAMSSLQDSCRVRATCAQRAKLQSELSERAQIYSSSLVSGAESLILGNLEMIY